MYQYADELIRRLLPVILAVLICLAPNGGNAQGRPSAVWMNSGLPTGYASVAYAPNGKSFAVAGYYCVYVYSSAGALTQTLPAGPSSVIAWSADSTMLAIAFGGLVQIEVLSTLASTTVFAPMDAVNSLAFSPDGKLLAIGGSNGFNGALELWNIKTGKIDASLKTAASTAVNSVTFSPDGKSLADGGLSYSTSTGKYSPVIEVWPLSTLSSPLELASSGGSIRSVAFAPKSGTLCDCGVAYQGSGSNIVETWTLPAGKLAKSYAMAATQVAYSHDGTKIYASSGGALESLPSSLASGPTVMIPAVNGVNQFAVSPSGTSVVCPLNATVTFGVAPGSGILLYSTTAGKTTPVTTTDMLAAIGLPAATSIAFSPDGNTIAVAGRTPTVPQTGSTPVGLSLFAATSGSRRYPAPTFNSYQSTSNGVSASWSPDSKTIGLITTDPTTYAPLVETWKLGAASASVLTTTLTAIASTGFSPTGKVFVDAGSTASAGEAEVRTVGSSAAPTVLQTSYQSVDTLSISADGKTLALGGYGTTPGVELWSLTGSKRLAILVTTASSVSGIAISPDGKTVAVAGSYVDSTGMHGIVEWWSTSTYKRLGSAKTDTQIANCLCYSKGGGYLFVGTEQNIQIFSDSNFGLTKTYTLEVEEGITSIAMSPSGATFAYSRVDGGIVVAKNPNAAAK